MNPTRIFIFLLVLITVSNTNAQKRLPLKTLIDSAEFYFEQGQIKKVQEVLRNPGKLPESLDAARFLLIRARVAEFEGFYFDAIRDYESAILFGRKNSDPVLTSAALIGKASASIDIGQVDSVLTLLQTAKQTDSSSMNNLLAELTTARYWQSQNQAAKALSFLQTAYDQAKLLKAERQMITSLSLMASVYFSLEPDMKRSIELLKQANALSDSSRHANYLARNYARLANTSMVLGDLKSAERYLQRARRIVDLTNNLPVKSYVYSSMAIWNSESGDVKTAVEIAREPIRIKRELGLIKQLQNDLVNQSEWQMHLGQYAEARKTIDEGLAASRSLKDNVFLQYFYDRLSRLDSITGNYKGAYSNLKRSIAFKDSTFSLQKVLAVKEISEKYEAEQKEKVIAEKELEIERKQLQLVAIGAGALIVILTMVVIIVAIRQKHRTRLMSEKQRQQEIKTQTIVNTQEDVQQAIARDIHDGLVQMMGAAKLSLQTIQASDSPASILEKTKKASSIIDDACMEARNISHQLLPYSLTRDGFASALEDSLKNSFSEFEFVNEGKAELKQDLAINLYRISQEVINNILRHAEAGFVRVILKISGKELNLSFHDNGKGFDPSTASRGAGILNMITRTELIQGKFAIDSAQGRGTTINISVPI